MAYLDMHAYKQIGFVLQIQMLHRVDTRHRGKQRRLEEDVVAQGDITDSLDNVGGAETITELLLPVPAFKDGANCWTSFTIRVRCMHKQKTFSRTSIETALIGTIPSVETSQPASHFTS